MINDIIAKGTKYVDSLNESLNKKEQELASLKSEVKRLEQLRKINLLGKAIKWTSRMTMPANWATSIEVGIDAWEIKGVGSSWIYELSFMLLGISLVLGINKLRKKNPDLKVRMRKEQLATK